MPRRRDPKLHAVQLSSFLRALARTGNVRATACDLGLNRATLTRRRASDPRFAQKWDAALALASARLHAAREDAPPDDPCRPPPAMRDAAHLVQQPGGRLQLRADGKARRVDRAVQQAFLSALAATANVRLAARVTGFAHSTFYTLARRDPGFEREMGLALEWGCAGLELALIESFTVEAHEHDAWRHNDVPPIPAMTPDQALTLLAMHRRDKTRDLRRMRKRRCESEDDLTARLGEAYREEQARSAHQLRIEATDAALIRALDRLKEKPPIAPLPSLDQVAAEMGGEGSRGGAIGRELIDGSCNETRESGRPERDHATKRSIYPP
ncbi:hypothetical protein [Sphingomonas baiyangensis]|uniref:Uncharacterized protein n=1 Tax=Sphingomonas baiyangensis TaxID=2572576 RepID=A0A4U1KZQ4_9SPHN|nr:hypothetical protein [Sphingomonas baiyangensis]TKD49911.1 hypothetical protein FBR43_03355 [Sphingomonas baiyangensis]